jgi:hypothetical protein
VSADLFRHKPPMPYDVIVSVKAFQGFDELRREALARRFFDWLSPGGLCFVETMNVVFQKEIEAPFRAAGFVEPARVAFEGEAKGVVFAHGSG